MDTTPGPGVAGHATWAGNTWRHGGAALWCGLSVDPQTDTPYIAPGNPGPDFSDATLKGQNLYADSVVALDIAGKAPRLKWYYRVAEHDTHDTDPAMPPLFFSGPVSGKTRALLAIADKAGNFVLLDRSDGRLVHRLSVADRVGLDPTPTTTGSKGDTGVRRLQELRAATGLGARAELSRRSAGRAREEFRSHQRCRRLDGENPPGAARCPTRLKAAHW